jgi:undecaprenyl-phosphate 4-deoxy-4-formamido-L-arabinose transferase
MPDARQERDPGAAVALSVIVPVFNAEGVLAGLFDRLYPVLDGLGRRYEAVFVDDGSRDRSATLLRQQYKLLPDRTRVVYLRGTAGQQAAIVAGLSACVGQRVVTLGTDLRSALAEIPLLLAELDRGHDLVTAIGRQPQDPTWSDNVLSFTGRLRERITGVRWSEDALPLQGYERHIVDAVLASDDAQIPIPVLACRFAANPGEILVADETRDAGESLGSFYRRLGRELELTTRLSLAPLRAFSLAGLGAAAFAFACGIYLTLHWLVAGPEADGLAGLFGALYLLMGVILFGMGLLAAYLGRIAEQTQGRPRCPVREELTPRHAARRGNP